MVKYILVALMTNTSGVDSYVTINQYDSSAVCIADIERYSKELVDGVKVLGDRMPEVDTLVIGCLRKNDEVAPAGFQIPF